MAGRMPAGTWWGTGGVRRWGIWRKPYTTTGYLQWLWRGKYPYGCSYKYRSCHRGVDVGNRGGLAKGMPVYAWGPGYVISRGFDPGGYATWTQIHYPGINATVTHGHLMYRSDLPVGTRVWRGKRIGKIGSKKAGINHSHQHIRAAWGRHVRCISPCQDIPPIRVWRRLAA